MTTLDTLARSSAEAIHHSVAFVPVRPASVGTAAGVAALWKFGSYAVAGALAGVAVVGALIIAGPDEAEVSRDPVPSTTVAPTTIPIEEAVPPTTAPVPSAKPPAPVVPPSSAIAPTTTTVSDAEPPMLEILSPSDGERVKTKITTFVGRTEPDATVVASGKFEATVAADGSWSIDLVLAPGANGVVFVATDPAGNATSRRMTITLDVEEPKVTTTTTIKETTTTTIAAWEFVANQKYGSCVEPIAYDIFSGKATPGTTVSISSEYGSGTTTANGDGTWNLKVLFPSAPYNKVFLVTAKDHTGAKRTFEMVSLYQG